MLVGGRIPWQELPSDFSSVNDQQSQCPLTVAAPRQRCSVKQRQLAWGLHRLQRSYRFTTPLQTAAATGPVHPTYVVPHVTHFKNLSADQFRHPLDQQNTRLLKLLPGVELVVKSLLGPVTEDMLLLDNVGTSLQVGPDQLPSLHRLLAEAAAVLGMDPPDLFVRQSSVPNAMTLAVRSRKPFIVVHTALIDLLTPRELQSVLAHELGHLQCDHGVWLTAAHALGSGFASVVPGVGRSVEDSLLRWLRAAELTCDRAALLVVQDYKVVVSSLMKLAGGSPSLAAELNVDAFLRQAKSYDDLQRANPMSFWLRNAQTSALTHPLPVLRAREIERYAQSEDFAALLRGSASAAMMANGQPTFSRRLA